MPTPLISNFTINTNAPIDSRIVASSSAVRDAIAYKYDGMQVFTTDSRVMWTYNATTATWSSNTDNNGIYSGNGSLLSNTFVNIGNINNSVGTQSYYFILSGSASNKLYFSSYYNRHDVSGDWTGVELIQKFSIDSLTSSSMAYISYNPSDPINNSHLGIDFGTSNTKRMSITGDGILRLYTPINSNGQINTTSTPAYSSSGYVNLYSQQTMTFSTTLSSSGGNLFATLCTNNTYNITTILTAPNNNILSGAILANTFNFSSGSNLVIQQPYVAGKNALSALNVFHQSGGGTIAGSITDMAGIKIDGYKPTYANININNYYGLLINPSYTVTGAALDPYYQAGYGSIYITNKYGLYQAGPYDLNYFAGNVGIGATPSTTNISLTVGTMSVKSILTTNQSWTNISGFGSGWSTTLSTPRYTKDAMGNVHLQGVLNSMSVSWSTTIFTLPVGYRPSMQIIIPCWYLSSAVYYTAYVYISTSGAVTISSYNSLSTTGQLDISPINFTTL